VIAPPLAPGTVLASGYEVIAHINRGRTLDVYDAWSAERATRVIAKALRPDRRNEARIARLLQEGSLLCELTHPHIVRGYELLQQPDPVVIMETLKGETLAHLVEEGAGPLEPVELSHLGLQLGSAIRYLHAHGILHLDLKPSNVVSEAGRAKLIDLSVAQAPGPLPAGVGTWCYMAPEQARGGLVDATADVWGIGAVLFEAATGKAPFDDGGWVESSESEEGLAVERPEASTSDTGGGPYPQLLEPAKRINELRDVAVEVADLVAACLEPEPTRRPSLARLMIGLEEISDLPPVERRWTRAARVVTPITATSGDRALAGERP
jgi:serine/threonine protein kinase